VTKLWASRFAWESYSASKLLLRERIARQVTGRVAGSVATYVESPRDKALGNTVKVRRKIEDLVAEVTARFEQRGLNYAEAATGAFVSLSRPILLF
jgi:altronate dehydratase